MKIQHSVNLANYTTIKIGGIAENFYCPESVEDLLALTKKINKFCIISGGSNLLINDQKRYDHVIYMGNMKQAITMLSDNSFNISSSVRLQKLIKEVNMHELGGMEFLYSVPAMLGGAIYMNAGRGKKTGLDISKFIVSVTTVKNGELQTYEKDECEFAYRKSIFQKKEDEIIVGAILKFEKKSVQDSEKAIMERLEYCREHQDHSANNFGSIFNKYDGKILKFAKYIHPRNAKAGVRFSKKTPNWLLNEGKGTFDQAIALIDYVKCLHKFLGKDVNTEVVIWD